MSIDFGLLTDMGKIEKLFDALATIEDGFGFDIETGYTGPSKPKYSLHPETAIVAGMSFSGDPSWARYIPLRHPNNPAIDDVQFARLLAKLLASGRGIAHHAKFELTHIAKFLRDRLSQDELREAGLAKDGYFPVKSDSMIEAYMMGAFRSHGLKPLVEEVFGYKMAVITDLFPAMTSKQEKAMRFTELELSPPVVSYACDDAAWCLALSRKHRPEVERKLLYRVEMALVPILAHMEDYGVQFDWPSMAKWRDHTEQFADAMRTELMKEFSEIIGEPVDINLGSPQQVADLLYNPEKMGLTTTRVTDSGNMSTDEKALAGLAKKHPSIKKLLQYREVKKLNSSYLDKFERDFAYAADGRTHPSHSQTTVVSGRFAVSDPPYQQLPKKYHFELNSGRTFDLNFRNFVVAGPEHYFMGFDYSQIELRVLAGVSGEPALVRAFNEDADVHALTASLMFEIPLEEVTEEQRQRGKTQNFALLYGQGPKGMAERLGISVEEAKILSEKYFDVYSSVKSWVGNQTKEGVRLGYTISKFGRKHPIWQLDSDKASIRATGERLCVNAPIQGGAADLAKIAMVRADRAIQDSEYRDHIHLIMNIHDALVYEIHMSVSPQVLIDLIHKEICIPVQGWPVIKADWEVGRRWGEMKKLKLDESNQIIRPAVG